MTRQQKAKNEAVKDLAIKLKGEFTRKNPDEEAAFTALNEHLLEPTAVARAIAREAFFIIQKEEAPEQLSPQGEALRQVLDVTHNGARIGLEPSEPSWAKVFDSPLHNNAASHYDRSHSIEDARWRSLCTLGEVVVANLGEQRDEATMAMIREALEEKPVNPVELQQRAA